MQTDNWKFYASQLGKKTGSGTGNASFLPKVTCYIGRHDKAGRHDKPHLAVHARNYIYLPYKMHSVHK
jgi:hypothetical protein